MKFSLIVTTFERYELFKNFLESLKSQTYKNFELIVLDQNVLNSIEMLCDHYKLFFNIIYIKISKSGLSHARNIGLEYTTGDIIAFPDDDCEYPCDLLSNLCFSFNKFSKYDFLCISVRDINTNDQLPFTPFKRPTQINKTNIFKTVTSIGLFIRVKKIIQKYDEEFGIGSIFGSCEEIDYVMRLISYGYIGFYDPSIFIYHRKVRMLSGSKGLRKIYHNATGYGAFFKKHYNQYRLKILNYNLIFNIIVKPISRIIISLITLKFSTTVIYSIILEGRIQGFLNYYKTGSKNKLLY